MGLLSWTLLCVAALAVNASPLERKGLLFEKSLQARSGLTVSAQELANFKFYAQYAGAAYCNSNSTDDGKAVTCDADVCPTVESDKAVITATVDYLTVTGIEGFVATDPTRSLVVVSYRGTQSIRNWITDAVFNMVSCNLVSGCEAHDGFYQAWQESSSEVFSAVKSALSSHPSYSLVVTGHSLGGAVATLAGAELRAAGYPCDIYTYGSPRVGNQALAEFVTNQPGGEYRVTHLDDPVPRLPPMFLGYRHTSPEYWLSDGTATTTDYTASDIEVCPGTANTNCNAGTWGFDTTAHSYYFEAIGACGPGGIQFRSETMTDEELTARVNKWQAMDMEYAAKLPQNSS